MSNAFAIGDDADEEMPEYLLTPDQLATKRAMGANKIAADKAAVAAAQKDAAASHDIAKKMSVQRPSPEALKKLGLARVHLASVNKQRAAFDAAHPEIRQDRESAEAAKEKQKALMAKLPYIIGGVLVLGGGGYFAYRKWMR